MADLDELDFSLLPEDLQHLVALVVKFAESDDAVRSDLLACTSTDELHNLGNTVVARWDPINAFVDENIQPPGPGRGLAVALDGLLQAGTEAQVELKARQPRQAGKGKKGVLIGTRSGLRRALSASILNLTR